MIKQNTVFIIGAGASKPYGYPTGKELRNNICKKPMTYTNDNEKILKRELNEFASIFFKSSTQSIDLFLARNPEYKDLGKFAIIAQIIYSERNSKFHEDIKIKDQDWYTYLFEKMSQTLIKPESYNLLKNNKVSFITFNYDRSLEQFMYESITNSFYSQKLHAKFTSEEIKYSDIFPFNIFHVYGKVANLNWEETNGFTYGFNSNDLNIHHLLNNIKIVYEREDIEKKSIQKTISDAEKIFFLGFGFADENLEILDIPRILDEKQHIYGTVYDLTEREISDIKNKFSIKRKINSSISGYKQLSNIFLENCDCLTLLRKYL